MDTADCIRHMIERAGKSGRQVSAELGKAPTYLSASLAKGGNMTAENLARIAKTVDYRLVLEGHGESIEVTPRGGPGDADKDQGTAE